MIVDLLNVIRDHVAALPSLAGADVVVASNPRFDTLVEDKISVVVSPVSVTSVYDARDVVKETTTICVAVAEYFADKFDDKAEGLLQLLPEIEQSFIGQDVLINETLYRWETTQSLGEPDTNRLKDVPGGLFDVDAIDNAFVYQAPVYTSYVRYLRPTRGVIVASTEEPSAEDEP